MRAVLAVASPFGCSTLAVGGVVRREVRDRGRDLLEVPEPTGEVARGVAPQRGAIGPPNVPCTSRALTHHHARRDRVGIGDVGDGTDVPSAARSAVVARPLPDPRR